MLRNLFGNKMGWDRYYLPRTGYSIFGSLYFLFTFQLSLFILHVALEAACILAVGLVFPPLAFSGYFLPRLIIPFLMHRWETMSNLNGAWRIDWIVPVVCFFVFLGGIIGFNDLFLEGVAHILVWVFDTF